MLCIRCYNIGFCRKKYSYLVSYSEMTYPFIQDGRNAGYDWSKRMGVSSEEFPNKLITSYICCGRAIIDPKTGREPEDFEVLFRPEKVSIEDWENRDNLDGSMPYVRDPDYRTFYRDNYMRPCGNRPRIDYRDRHRLILSLLRAILGDGSWMWGVRATNDN